MSGGLVDENRWQCSWLHPGTTGIPPLHVLRNLHHPERPIRGAGEGAGGDGCLPSEMEDMIREVETTLLPEE